jgi:hypothetical protein
MSAQDAMKEFIEIYRAIFRDPRFSTYQRSRALENAVYSLLDRKGWRHDMKLMGSHDSDDECRVYVFYSLHSAPCSWLVV